MARTRAYLSLGSNLGDRLVNLAGAVRALGAAAAQLCAVSPVYETAPLDANGAVAADQPPYLNCAVSADVDVGAAELRSLTAAIERSLGRRARERWASREIDIDVVLFGDERITTPELIVPHPRMSERAFVLRPLVDLDPNISAPGIGRLADLLPSVAGQGCTFHAAAEELLALARPLGWSRRTS